MTSPQPALLRPRARRRDLQKDEEDETDGLPPGWSRDFRTLVAAEPALHGEC